jgi:hypothetical protein
VANNEFTVALLADGSQQVMKQSQIYALPPYACVLFTDSAAPFFQLSTTVTFTASVNVALTGGQATVAGGFIREGNNPTTVVFLKRIH